MPVAELGDWLDEQMAVPDALWYVKRLAANDTLATGSHQYGAYIPLRVAYDVAPLLDRQGSLVTECDLLLRIDSHADARTARLKRYGSKREARITRLGGLRSALLDPDATGALAVFAFRRETQTDPPACHVWVCDNAVDEDRIEMYIGPVEPGEGRTWPDLLAPLRQPKDCWLEPDEFPPGWGDRYPTGAEMVRKAIELRSDLSIDSVDVDTRLTRRRKCEETLFYSIEHAFEFPRVSAGYKNMQAFVDHARPVLQRRMARSGRSLELQVRQILIEEELVEEQHFSYQPVSEGAKRPDFLFPNADAYHNPDFPPQQLRMLGVKTTLKDRWRQILEEADRIENKHLLTLQEGVSEKQFRAMEQAGVQLVVPRSLHERYPRPVRPALLTLEDFLADVRALAP